MINFTLRCYFLAVRYRLEIRNYFRLSYLDRLSLYLVAGFLCMFACEVGASAYAYHGHQRPGQYIRIR